MAPDPPPAPLPTFLALRMTDKPLALSEFPCCTRTDVVNNELQATEYREGLLPLPLLLLDATEDRNLWTAPLYCSSFTTFNTNVESPSVRTGEAKADLQGDSALTVDVGRAALHSQEMDDSLSSLLKRLSIA